MPIKSKASPPSLDKVHVVFLARTSISPAFRTSNLSFALRGVNLTLLASPSMAAAIALQKSTSIPAHFPDASALENPGTP